MPSTWTQQMDDILLAGVKAGKTYAMIASEINATCNPGRRVSRNSAIGRAKRKGWSDQAPSYKPQPKRSPKPRVRVQVAPKPQPKPVKVEAPAIIPDIEPEPIEVKEPAKADQFTTTIMQLRDRQCRSLTKRPDEHGEMETYYCAKPVKPKSRLWFCCDCMPGVLATGPIWQGA